VRAFRPDRIVLALRSDEHAAWQEQNLAEQIANETGLPLTVFAIDAQGRVRAG
jgi:hypothetical protein